jgi:hypothetical protein
VECPGRLIALREGLATLSFEARYDLARNHALLAGSGLSVAEGAAEAERAVALLRQLVAEDYRNAMMRTDPDLDSQRSRPDFQTLMMDLAFPTDPFAAAR